MQSQEEGRMDLDVGQMDSSPHGALEVVPHKHIHICCRANRLLRLSSVICLFNHSLVDKHSSYFKSFAL